mgnify:CR=1 FL=1
MDDHYNQVMDRIKSAPAGQARLYFGYSSVLDRAAFEEWKMQHGYPHFNLPEGEIVKAQDWKMDFNFPSRWWGGRAPGLVSSPGDAVYGKLYSLRSEEWPMIQHKEGHVTGAAVELNVMVTRSDGSRVEATAFTTNPVRVAHDGPVSARYLAAYEKGARDAGLPEEFIASVLRAQ